MSNIPVKQSAHSMKRNNGGDSDKLYDRSQISLVN